VGHLALVLVASVLGLSQTAQAAPVSLGIAGNFNAFVLGDYKSSGSDVEGALAVQGNATLSNYSVNAQKQSGYAGDALVVGGNLRFNNGSINNGNAYVGGTYKVSNLGFNGTRQQGSAPFSFASAEQQLEQLSASLDALQANGKAVFNPWGGVTLSGDGTTATQVFDVQGERLLGINNFMFSGLSAGQTLIFNISGEEAGFKNVGLSGFANYNVLFNFVDATELTLNGAGVYGSILAPDATVKGGNGQINGNVVVKSWDSNIQINDNHLFVPTAVSGFSAAANDSQVLTGQSQLLTAQTIGSSAVYSVPEPGSLALVMSGLSLAAILSRRRARFALKLNNT
jgi:choice-of-anchor A domain-containing protein